MATTGAYGGTECKEQDRSQNRYCRKIPIQCPQGIIGETKIPKLVSNNHTNSNEFIGHPLSEEFLTAWREPVDYSDSNRGKALVRWLPNRVIVAKYISDSEYIYDSILKGWKPVDNKTSLDKIVVPVQHGHMVYVGQFQNGSITGQGTLHLSWCREGREVCN